MSTCSAILTAILVCASVLLPQASAIRCYQCKSLTEPNCAKEKIEPSDNIRMVDCEIQPKPNRMDNFLPVTKCDMVVIRDRAGKIISRDCHFEIAGQEHKSCRTQNPGEELESCATCNGDLCNGNMNGNGASANSIISKWMMISVGISFVFLKKFYSLV